MKAFIVHAHPEPQSFNGALTSTAIAALQQAGHEVSVSDLYAMRWEARSDRQNVTTVANADVYKQQVEELFALSNAGFNQDIQQEMDKLFACDLLILQFPLWWFSMPAILKGWIDRVFAMGTIYGHGRWYDNGVFSGKRAMLSLTTGGAASMYGRDGINGDIESLLFPIQHGILRLVGFDVLAPFISWEPARCTPAVRAKYLANYKARLAQFETESPLTFPHLSDYDPISFRLRKPH